MNQSKVNKRLSIKGYAIRILAAAVIATVLNIIVFLIGDAAGAFPDNIKVMAENSLQLSNVIMMSILGTVVGILVFAAVGSFKVFRIIAVIGFILMIYTPISVANATTSFIVCLEIMHVIAAAVVIWVASWKSAN